MEEAQAASGSETWMSSLQLAAAVLVFFLFYVRTHWTPLPDGLLMILFCLSSVLCFESVCWFDDGVYAYFEASL